MSSYGRKQHHNLHKRSMLMMSETRRQAIACWSMCMHSSLG